MFSKVLVTTLMVAFGCVQAMQTPPKLNTLQDLYLYLHQELTYQNTDQEVNVINRRVGAFLHNNPDVILEKVVLRSEGLDCVQALHRLYASFAFHDVFTGEPVLRKKIIQFCASAFIRACIVSKDSSPRLFYGLLRYTILMGLVEPNNIVFYHDKKRYRLPEYLNLHGRVDLYEILREHKMFFELDMQPSNEHELKQDKREVLKIYASEGGIVGYMYEHRNDKKSVQVLKRYLERFGHHLTKKERPRLYLPEMSLFEVAKNSTIKDSILTELAFAAVRLNDPFLYKKVLESLYRAGSFRVPVTMADALGQTPAHKAVMSGAYKFFVPQMILRDIDDQDYYNLLPVHYAFLRLPKIPRYPLKTILGLLKGGSHQGVLPIDYPNEFENEDLDVAITDDIVVPLGRFVGLNGLQRYFGNSPLYVSWLHYVLATLKPVSHRQHDLRVYVARELQEALYNLAPQYRYSNLNKTLMRVAQANVQQSQALRDKFIYEQLKIRKDDEAQRKLEEIEQTKEREKELMIEALQQFNASKTEQQFFDTLDNQAYAKYLMRPVILAYLKNIIDQAVFNDVLLVHALNALNRTGKLDKDMISHVIQHALTKNDKRFSGVARALMAATDMFTHLKELLSYYKHQKKYDLMQKLLRNIARLPIQLLPFKQSLQDLKQLRVLFDQLVQQAFEEKKQPFVKTVAKYNFTTDFDANELQEKLGLPFKFKNQGKYFDNVSLLHLAVLDENVALVEAILQQPVRDQLLLHAGSDGKMPLHMALNQAVIYQNKSNEEQLNVMLEIANGLLDRDMRANIESNVTNLFIDDLYTPDADGRYPIDFAAQLQDIDILKKVLTLMKSHSDDWFQAPKSPNIHFVNARVSWDGKRNPLHWAAWYDYLNHAKFILEQTPMQHQAELYTGFCREKMYWYDERKKQYAREPMTVHMTPQALALINNNIDTFDYLFSYYVEKRNVQLSKAVKGRNAVEVLSSIDQIIVTYKMNQFADLLLRKSLKDPFFGSYINEAHGVRALAHNGIERFYASLLEKDGFKSHEDFIAGFLWRYPPDKSFYEKLLDRAFSQEEENVVNTILCFAAQRLPVGEAIQLFDGYLKKLQGGIFAQAKELNKQSEKGADIHEIIESSVKIQLEKMLKQLERLWRVQYYGLDLLHYAIKGDNYELVFKLIDEKKFNPNRELLALPKLLTYKKPGAKMSMTTLTAIDFAQQSEEEGSKGIFEYLLSSQEKFSLVKRVIENPEKFTIGYINQYYSRYPENWFIDDYQGETLLDIAIGRSSDKLILWLLGKAITLNKPDSFKKMLPKFDQYLNEKYPGAGVIIQELPIVKDNGERGEKIITYFEKSEHKALKEVYERYFLEQEQEVREDVLKRQQIKKIEVSEGFQSQENLIAELPDSLQILKARLQQLVGGLSNFAVN